MSYNYHNHGSIVQAYLETVHDFDLSDITPDPKLAKLLSDLRRRPWIFTASTRKHVRRCLRRLQVDEDLLEGIVDTYLCDLETKHLPRSFRRAMELAGSSTCLLCDDSSENILAAKRMGWWAVLVGHERRGGGIKRCEADFHIASIHELPTVLPQLFTEKRIS